MTPHNKVIRDNIPQIIQNSGRTCNTKTLSDSEFLEKLEIKLAEELAEYNQDKTLIELADMLEVIYRIAELKGTDAESLDKIRNEKGEKNGRFDKNLYLIDAQD